MKKKNIASFIALVVIIGLLIFLAFIQINHQTNKYDNLEIDSSELNIFFFNVGQAESILISSDNYNMLIDCGNNSDGKYISEFLKSQGIKELNYLIGTHIDEDHIGGMQEVLSNIQVQTLYMPYSTYEGKQFYTQLQSYIENKNVNRQQIEKSKETKYKLGQAEWKCLSVDNSNPSDKNKFNDTSIVIELEFGNTKYLFTGDISEKLDSNIEGLEKVDVLKVAHHGAKGTTSTEFLQKVNPTYAIISAGNNKNYNHPDETIIQRLIDEGVKQENIYITKNQGTIWLKSDGEKITIETRKDIDLDGANKLGYKSIFDICSYFLYGFGTATYLLPSY